MPFSPGSESATSARSSAPARAVHSPRFGVLAAVLEVEELVADAAEGLHVDAGAEVRARRRRRCRRTGISSAGAATSAASWRE